MMNRLAPLEQRRADESEYCTESGGRQLKRREALRWALRVGLAALGKGGAHPCRQTALAVWSLERRAVDESLYYYESRGCSSGC